MREAQYYTCCIRLNGVDAFVIWHENEPDEFLRSVDGRLLVATSATELQAVADKLGLKLSAEEPSVFNFDRVRNWCRRPTAEGVDCATFLNVWNFFDDLEGLHSGRFTAYVQLSEAALACYDKLFHGNNLPAMTPPGKSFEPSWSPEELLQIRGVFDAGLNALTAVLPFEDSRR